MILRLMIDQHTHTQKYTYIFAHHRTKYKVEQTPPPPSRLWFKQSLTFFWCTKSVSTVLVFLKTKIIVVIIKRI